MRHLTLTAVIATLLIVGAQACGGMEEDFEGTIESTSQALWQDQFEVNNGPFMATPFPPGPNKFQRLTINGPDEDWFSLPVAAGQMLIAKILFKHADADLDLAVYQKPGRRFTLIGISKTRTDNESLVLTGLQEGETWVKVWGNGGDAMYDLELWAR